MAASGAALAVNELGTNDTDTLTGTNGDDNLVGRGLAAFETMRSREFRRELRVR